MDSLLLTIVLLVYPKADSMFIVSTELFKKEAERHYVELPYREIEFQLVYNMTNDTLAISETHLDITKWTLYVDLGYVISCLDEPGVFHTLMFHEFGHIYLNKDDRRRGKTLMNYKFVSIDILSYYRRDKLLFNLFRR